MKKLLSILFLLLAVVTISAQNATFETLILKNSLRLGAVTVTSITTDTTLAAATDLQLATGRVVKIYASKLGGRPVSTTAPTSGQVMKWNGSIWAPAADAGAGVTALAGENYLALAGVTITANAINLGTTNATGTLAAGRFPGLTGDVTNTAGSLATTVGKIQNVSVSATTPTTNQVLKYNGTVWAPAADASGVTALAGENYLSLAGVTVTANAINLSNTNVTGTLAAARFPALTGDVTNTAGAVATTISANAVTTSKVLDGTLLFADWAQNSATTNQVPKWNGTAWAAAADANSGGTVTDVSVATANGFSGTVATSTTTPAITLTQQDAAADGTTKGKATYTAADFNTASGVVSIDYTNAQKGTTSQPGFITSADWNTFNGRMGGGGTTNNIPKLAGTSTLANSQFWDDGTRLAIKNSSSVLLLQTTATNSGTHRLDFSWRSATDDAPSASVVGLAGGSYSRGTLEIWVNATPNDIVAASAADRNVAFTGLSTTFYKPTFVAAARFAFAPTTNDAGNAQLDFGHKANFTETKVGIVSAAYTQFSRGDLRFCVRAIDDSNVYDPTTADCQMRIDFLGKIAMGLINPLAKLHVQGQGNTSSTYDLLVTNSNGITSTASIAARSDGNVGFGTNTPTQPADFAGNIRSRGAIYDNANSPGSSGNVPVSTGSGWAWGTGTVYAPLAGTYLTAASDATLTNERVLTAGANVKITDGGANSTMTVATCTENIAFSGVIAPTALSGTNNDYNPTGLSTASTIRQDVNAGAVLTGISGGAAGRLLILLNISTTNTLILYDNNPLSTAGNRFILGGSNIEVRANGSATFQYDATTSRWRLISLATPGAQSITYEYTTAVTNSALIVPSGAKAAHITVVGAGGGGASGRKGATSTVRCGGGGGAGGGISSTMYPLAGDIVSFYVNVGTAGAGGASQTTNSTNGNNGTPGGESDVRADATTTAARIIRASGGFAGAGGTAVDGQGGTIPDITDMTGTVGGGASTSGGNGFLGGYSNTRCPGGGGAGGGINTSNTAGTGGAGGDGYQYLQAGGASAGANAASVSLSRESGGGGAGGNATTLANAGAGGNGVRGGGGGGGGASLDSVGNSGAGGAGGPGYVKIVFIF